MNVFERADRLQLHNDLVFDQKIESMLANLMVFVEQDDRFLSNELDPTQSEFNCQCSLVDVFKKARSKLAVHADCRCYNSIGEFPILQPSYFPAFLIHL